MNAKKWNIIRAVSIIFFLITAISFIFTPFTGDLHVLFAGSKQADYFGKNWLYNAFSVWDLKGQLYRLFLYILYKIATLFSTFSTYSYEVITNLIFAIGVLLVMWVSILFCFCILEKRKKLIYVLLGCSAIFASVGMSHIQAEMICVLKLILALAIYVNAKVKEKNKSIKLLLSGMIIGSMFFYKSIIILMSISFVGVIMLYNRKIGSKMSIKDFFALVIGAVITIAFVSGVIFIVNPSEFQNMANAAVYQNTLLSGNHVSIRSIIYNFGCGFMISLYNYPVVLVGFIVAIDSLVQDLRVKQWKMVFLRVGTWLIPVIIVALANCYFQYHYFLFVFVSLVEIIMHDWTKYAPANVKSEIIVAVCVLVLAYLIIKVFNWPYNQKLFCVCVALFIALFFVNEVTFRKYLFEINVFLPLLIGMTIYICYMSVFSDNFIGNIECNSLLYTNDNRNVLSQIDDDETVMYLDDGTGAYLIQNKSYLNEYYPLPIQRIYEGSKYEELESHTRALNKALDFNGRYVCVYAEWMFGESKNVLLQEKIKKEYNEMGRIKVWSMDPNIFNIPSDQEKYFILYRRK